jgi:hypothetical protein
VQIEEAGMHIQIFKLRAKFTLGQANMLTTTNIPVQKYEATMVRAKGFHFVITSPFLSLDDYNQFCFRRREISCGGIFTDIWIFLNFFCLLTHSVFPH